MSYINEITLRFKTNKSPSRKLQEGKVAHFPNKWLIMYPHAVLRTNNKFNLIKIKDN